MSSCNGFLELDDIFSWDKTFIVVLSFICMFWGTYLFCRWAMTLSAFLKCASDASWIFFPSAIIYWPLVRFGTIFINLWSYQSFLYLLFHFRIDPSILLCGSAFFEIWWYILITRLSWLYCHLSAYFEGHLFCRWVIAGAAPLLTKFHKLWALLV